MRNRELQGQDIVQTDYFGWSIYCCFKVSSKNTGITP